MQKNEPMNISDCFEIADAWIRDFGLFSRSPLKETTLCGLDFDRHFVLLTLICFLIYLGPQCSGI